VHNLETNCVVYESAICDEYLCDVADEIVSEEASQEVRNIRPKSATDRAKMRLLNDHYDSKVGPAQYTFLMNQDESKDEELKAELEEALLVLENSIISTGGPFLMGSSFTIADAHALPFFLRLYVSLKHFKSYELPADKFPMLLEWFAECSKRPSSQATSKSDEKIIEVYSKFVSNDYAFGGLNRNKK